VRVKQFPFKYNLVIRYDRRRIAKLQRLQSERPIWVIVGLRTQRGVVKGAQEQRSGQVRPGQRSLSLMLGLHDGNYMLHLDS
jgi:hypothetical protein